MPNYIYGCTKDKRHPRKEVTHRITEDPLIKCDICKAPMARVPQPFRFYLSPFEVLTDWSEENWRRHKARKRGFPSTPRFSPYQVNRPIPIGGRDFEHRRLRKDASTKNN